MSIYSLRIFVALCVFALSALALCATPSTTDPDQTLGRLFYTPQRRAILDQLRDRNIHISPEQQEDSLRLDGIVRSSDGHNTVWINGEAHHDKPPVASLGDRSARVFSGNGHSVDVRVGETVTLTPPGTTENAK